MQRLNHAHYFKLNIYKDIHVCRCTCTMLNLKEAGVNFCIYIYWHALSHWPTLNINIHAGTSIKSPAINNPTCNSWYASLDPVGFCGFSYWWNGRKTSMMKYQERTQNKNQKFRMMQELDFAPQLIWQVVPSRGEVEN